MFSLLTLKNWVIMPPPFKIKKYKKTFKWSFGKIMVHLLCNRRPLKHLGDKCIQIFIRGGISSDIQLEV